MPPAKKRKSLDDRLKEVYAREEAVERAADALTKRAQRLTEKAEQLAAGADAAMATAEQEIEKRAAAATEKAQSAASARFTDQHGEVADRLARGLPAFEGAPRPTARETCAALTLIAALDQKARDREDKQGGGNGTTIILVKSPYNDGESIEMEVRAVATDE